MDSMQHNMAIIQAFSAFEHRALRGRGLRLAYRAYRDEADLSDWAFREQVDLVAISTEHQGNFENSELESLRWARELNNLFKINLAPESGVIRFNEFWSADDD